MQTLRDENSRLKQVLAETVLENRVLKKSLTASRVGEHFGRRLFSGWMAEVRVDCHAGYRGDETPRCFHLEGKTIEIAAILGRWKEPGAFFFRFQGSDGRVYVLRRDEQAGGWEIPEVAG